MDAENFDRSALAMVTKLRQLADEIEKHGIRSGTAPVLIVEYGIEDLPSSLVDSVVQRKPTGRRTIRGEWVLRGHE